MNPICNYPLSKDVCRTFYPCNSNPILFNHTEMARVHKKCPDHNFKNKTKLKKIPDLIKILIQVKGSRKKRAIVFNTSDFKNL